MQCPPLVQLTSDNSLTLLKLRGKIKLERTSDFIPVESDHTWLLVLPDLAQIEKYPIAADQTKANIEIDQEFIPTAVALVPLSLCLRESVLIANISSRKGMHNERDKRKARATGTETDEGGRGRTGRTDGRTEERPRW